MANRHPKTLRAWTLGTLIMRTPKKQAIRLDQMLAAKEIDVEAVGAEFDAARKKRSPRFFSE